MCKQFFIFLLLSLFSQIFGQVKSINPSYLGHTGKPSFSIPQNREDDWNITYRNFTQSEHAYSIPKTEMLLLKQAANDKRDRSNVHQPMPTLRNNLPKPVMGINYEGNIQGNNVPPDNTMNISKNGFLISAINSNIIFGNSTGKKTFTQNLVDFFRFAPGGVNASIYDPKVIYDHEWNRFIVMALHGNTPASTKLLVGFSKHEDPAAGFYFYSFDGNPLGDDHWYDYPNVGLTKESFFFSGLMRDNDGIWQYTVLYQIDKASCFNGTESVWAYYSDVKNADGEKAFNLVPAHTSWNTYPASKMYFISNEANGGDQYHLHLVDGNVKSNPTLQAYQVTGPMTELAPDGRQPNTANMMNTFDSRIWGAMELNGIIHFAAHVNSPENTSGIFYGRFNINDKTITGTHYYHKDFDYGFGTFAGIGHLESSDTVLLNMLKTGPSLFPSQVAVICSGTGDEFNFSEENRTKTGTGFVDALDGNRERWGDYTTTCRRFNSNRPEVWITGCYGQGTYGTWLAQYFNDSTGVNIDFFADKTTLNPGQSAKFSFVAPTNFTISSWEINNGQSNSSTALNPTIKYDQLGSYDAALTLVDDQNISHTILKKDFITVIPVVLPPVANFSVDRDSIYQGETVNFTDQSTNDPLDFSWTFSNGIPAASKLKNPSIRYDKKGQFLVNLTVKNYAGEDNETRQKYITVLEAKAPVVNFSANKTTISPGESIEFLDLSTNVPTSWAWEFEGGEPTTSALKNPIVTYSQKGQYAVKLKVSNFAGKDSVIQGNYVNVIETATEDEQIDFVSQISLYPNPSAGELITTQFFTIESIEMEVYIVNQSGQKIKSILDQRIKQGRNELSFTPPISLPKGIYYLVFASENKLRSKSFVIR